MIVGQSDSLLSKHSLSQQEIVLTGAEQVICGPSADRQQLIVSAPSNGSVTLSPSPGQTLYGGITLYAGDKPLILTKGVNGDLPCRQWNATASDYQRGHSANGVVGLFRNFEAATAATTTLTVPAQSGNTHVIEVVSAGFKPASAAFFTVVDSSSYIIATHVHTNLVVSFSRGFTCARGSAITLNLSSGGTGVQGVLSIAGYTVGPQRLTVFELVPPGVRRPIQQGGRVPRVI